MIDVCLTASALDSSKLASIAKALQRHFHLRPLPKRTGPVRNSKAGAARLHFTTRRLPGPYGVDRETGVSVSMCESRGISRYAGIDEQTYFLICSLLGVSQWRVLIGNELLRSEDLRHPSNVRCLFANPEIVQDYALHLEEPHICSGCVHFYHCLGADSELIALHEVIADIEAARRVDAGLPRRLESDVS